MTRAQMPGRGAQPLHAVPPARCSLAESLSNEERVLLAELGVHAGRPQLHLVPQQDAPVPRPTAVAELRRARWRQRVADWTTRVAIAAVAAWAVISLLARFEGLAP